jgi:hypothetical protein
MKSPEEVTQWVKQRYLRQRWRWMEGHGSWPLLVSLERPKQREVLKDFPAVQRWSAAWNTWRSAHMTAGKDAASAPQMQMSTIAWQGVGEQTLPETLSFPSAECVAMFCHDAKAWRLVETRRNVMLERWPTLLATGFGPHYETLAIYDEADFVRLIALLSWFVENPKSGLYLRQLPVPGIDTKWIDLKRRGLVADLVRRITCPTLTALPDLRPNELERSGNDTTTAAELDEVSLNFYDICGLRRPPTKLHLIVLCPALRAALGGLRDVVAPIEELAQLEFKPARALISENKDTGLSLPDIPGTVAFIKLGNAVSLLGQLPWVQKRPVLYWGDVDTYGFSILAQARKTLGNVRSIMMDLETLERHRDRVVDERQQATNVDHALLTTQELETYQGLLKNTWWTRKRLEQERLDWRYALTKISDASTFG